MHWPYLREAVREATQIPSQRNLTRRLNFCQWTKAASVWIPPEAWAACADASLTAASLVGRSCCLGIDLSSKIDLSSVSLAFDRPLNGTAPGGLNTAVDAWTCFWMPEKSIERRAQEDGIDYPSWARAREGFLFTTPGDIVDHDAILTFVLALTKRYKVLATGIDQAGAAAFTTRLQRELGESTIHEVPQGFRHLSEPSKLLEALVVSRQLRHPNNPVMNWCMGNVAIESNSWEEIRPVKISQRQRIDGAVSSDSRARDVPAASAGARARTDPDDFWWQVKEHKMVTAWLARLGLSVAPRPTHAPSHHERVTSTTLSWLDRFAPQRTGREVRTRYEGCTRHEEFIYHPMTRDEAKAEADRWFSSGRRSRNPFGGRR